jgi:uncharacterized DUF497 family protein
MWDWDEAKRQRTLQNRGIDFADVTRFDLQTAVIDPDLRRDYGEVRLLALGMIDGRLHMLCFTRRRKIARVISLRRANAREYREWLASQS